MEIFPPTPSRLFLFQGDLSDFDSFSNKIDTADSNTDLEKG